MAAIIKRAKQYDNPEASGELVEFYLAHQNGMDRSKSYALPIKVNGYEFTAKFGEKNILPKAVVQQLQNCKSAIHPTANTGRVDISRGGEGRPASQLQQSQQREQYINDYDIVIQKEA